MQGTRFDIYFTGQLLPDQDPVTVREKIRRMFRADDAQLQRLFSGEPVRIKAGVDEETAVRFRVSFRQAGAVVEIRPLGASAAAPAAETRQQAPRSQPEAKEPFELLPPKTGSLIDCAAEVTPREIPDISHITLAPSGARIDETPPPPPLQIDTSKLKLVD